MVLSGLIMEQKYVVKLEKETTWGLSHGIVNGTLQIYTEGIVFKTNDTLIDGIGNLGVGTSIKDVPNGQLFIPVGKIENAHKNSFRAVFMQHTLHIKLKDGLIIIFRMQTSQIDRFVHAINKLIGT